MKALVITGFVALAVVVYLWPQFQRIYRFWIWIDAEDMNDPYRRKIRAKGR